MTLTFDFTCSIGMSTHILTLSGSLGFGAATMLDTQGVDPTASSLILRSSSFFSSASF